MRLSLFLPLYLCISAFVAFSVSVAYADPTSAVAVNQVVDQFASLDNTSLLVLLGCWGVSLALRSFAPQGHFFHTLYGGAFLTVVTFLANATAAYVQQGHGVHLSGFLRALVSALVTSGLLYNPSVPKGETPPLAQEKLGGGLK